MTRVTRLRAAWARLRRFGSPLGRDAPAPLPPPDLPAGRTVLLPGRGETFVRVQEGPAGQPTVVLLHGWLASGELNWFGVYPELKGRYPVVSIDHRGHGRGIRSQRAFSLEDCADDVAALIGVLGLDRVVLAGYSMGGPIALLCAERHPARVEALVLAATAMEWRATRLDRLPWRLLILLGRAWRSGRAEQVAARLFREAAERNEGLRPLVPWLVGELRRTSAIDVMGAGRALAGYDFRPHAARLALPAAVVLTTRDRLVQPRKQRELAEALGAEVFTLQADHDACVVAFEEFAATMAAAVDHVVGARV